MVFTIMKFFFYIGVCTTNFLQFWFNGQKILAILPVIFWTWFLYIYL